MNATLTTFYLIYSKNQTSLFLYYISCKENKCWKSFKIMRELLFSHSLYSHLEIENFRVLTNLPPLNGISSRDLKKEEATRREINKNIATEVGRRSSSFVDR
jgi:hypothetical protein